MKLATVEKVIEILPIEGADCIEIAVIMGWEVVVKKGKFENGDYCIYIPIDTVVDLSKPYFEGAESRLKGGRIKTTKIRGVWSQGFALGINDVDFEVPLEEDYDVGELLNMKKYEKDEQSVVSLVRDPNKTYKESEFLPFPHEIIPKTDEPNFKTKHKALTELQGKEMYITKKLDGSSMTLIWLDGNFMVCSRNIILYSIIDGIIMVEVDSKDAQMKINFVKKHNFADLPISNFAVQGEFFGPGVGPNKMKFKKLGYSLFTVKELIRNSDQRFLSGTYLSYYQLIDFCSQYSFDMVPVISISICGEDLTIKSFQEISNGIEYDGITGEGIVVRPTIPFVSRILGRHFSVKIINQNFKD